MDACPGRAIPALIAGSAALQTEHGAVNRFLLVEPDGTVHHYDKRHLFRMADEHHHYEAGNQRVVFEWRGWRILPLVCYDLRFPVWSRNQNDYDVGAVCRQLAGAALAALAVAADRPRD